MPLQCLCSAAYDPPIPSHEDITEVVAGDALDFIVDLGKVASLVVADYIELAPVGNPPHHPPVRTRLDANLRAGHQARSNQTIKPLVDFPYAALVFRATVTCESDSTPEGGVKSWGSGGGGCGDGW